MRNWLRVFTAWSVLAAVLVAAGAAYSPHAFGIGEVGEIHAKHALIEISNGLCHGRITFTLDQSTSSSWRRMSGRPIHGADAPRISMRAGDRHVAGRVLVATEKPSQKKKTNVFWLVVVSGRLALGDSDFHTLTSAGGTCLSWSRCLIPIRSWAAAGIGSPLAISH